MKNSVETLHRIEIIILGKKDRIHALSLNVHRGRFLNPDDKICVSWFWFFFMDQQNKRQLHQDDIKNCSRDVESHVKCVKAKRCIVH